MYDNIMTEQFVGATFVGLLKNNLFSIALSELNRIERQLKTDLLEKYNTLICVTNNEIFSVIEKYEDIFRMESDTIFLKKIDNKQKENIIIELNGYFTSGIPNNVHLEIQEIIEKAIKEKK